MRMGRSTRFYFYPSNTAQQYNQMNVLAAIKIYTLSGKVVRVFKNARNGEVWDGRDQVGNLLGPDIYLYQVIATSPVIQKTVKSKVKKLIIHPPR
jgi:flagellar hook assembly protein FlgD